MALQFILCKSLFAEQINDKTFSAFIIQAQQLKDNNHIKAFLHLQTQSENIASLKVDNQLIYYKTLAELFVEQGQYQKSKTVASNAIQLAKRFTISNITVSELKSSRGFAYESLGDYKSARSDYLAALDIADSLNHKKNVATELINLGALDYLMEKFDRSLVMFNDALAIAQKINDDELSGYIYAELGILYSLLGQSEKSLAHYQKSYEFYLQGGKTYYAYNTLRNIAANYASNERFEDAIKIFRKIISKRNEIGNGELMSSVYSGMAWAHIRKKDKNPEAAYQYMLIASQYIEDAEQVDIPLSHALDRSYLFIELERYQEALASLQIANEYLKKNAQTDQKAMGTMSRLNLLYLKAETYFKIEDYAQASLAQDELLDYVLSLPDKTNIDEVEDLRMRYESKQIDLQNKILAQEKSVQKLKLAKKKTSVENRHYFIVVFAIFSLGLAWLLVKTMSGQKQLLKASQTDSLTGVANRRRLMELGEIFFKQAVENSMPFSLLVVDVDDFKKINDSFGHKVGDQTLKVIALTGQTNMRETDVFGRLGGEEFVVLLPDTPNEQAKLIAERLRLSVWQKKWHPKGLKSVSLSIGLASFVLSKHQDFEALLKEADTFLYHAKHQGKNKVCHDE